MKPRPLFFLRALPSIGALLLVLVGCGGAGASGVAAGARALTEGRALQVIGEAAQDAGYDLGQGPVALVDGVELQLDLRVGDGPFAIEWLSAQDRADNPSLPTPAPDAQLQIVSDPSGTQVLLLDAESYEYELDRERVQAGAASAGDVEARLRRDVRDFLVYAAGG